MTSLVPQSFIPGYRLQSGTDLNVALANPQWSTTMSLEATTGGTAATSAKIVNTITNITSATAGAGVTVPRSAIGRFLVLINSSANPVTVFAEGDATINGGTSYTLPAGESVTLSGIGATTWQVNSYGGDGGAANILDFGAVGDAKTVNWPGQPFRNVSISAGSNLLTISGTTFSADDVGKTISVGSAGPATVTPGVNRQLVTTIANFNPSFPNRVELAANADATVNSSIIPIPVTWGTNNTTSIQAAINSLNSSSIYVPAGSYLITAFLNFPSQKIIYGDGYASNIRQITPDTSVIRTSNFIGGCTIKQLRLTLADGTNAAESGTSPAAINMIRCTNSIIDSNFIEGGSSGPMGVNCYLAEKISITNNFIYGNKSARLVTTFSGQMTGAGATRTLTVSGQLDGTIVAGQTFYWGTNDSITITSGSGTSWTGTISNTNALNPSGTVTFKAYSLYAAGAADITATSFSSDLTIEGNYCLSNTSQGIQISPIGYELDCIVSNNNVVTLDPATCYPGGTWAEIDTAYASLIRRTGIGISYNAASNGGPRTIVNGNLVRNTLWAGVYRALNAVTSGGKNNGPCIISNNLISNIGFNSSDSIGGGIRFTQADAGDLINGNVIVNYQSIYAGGITVTSEVAYDSTGFLPVTNNVVRNSVSVGIKLESRAVNVLVSNNTLINNVGIDIYAEAAASSPICAGHKIVRNYCKRPSGSVVSSIYIDPQSSTLVNDVYDNIIEGGNNTATFGVRFQESVANYTSFQGYMVPTANPAIRTVSVIGQLVGALEIGQVFQWGTTGATLTLTSGSGATWTGTVSPSSAPDPGVVTFSNGVSFLGQMTGSGGTRTLTVISQLIGTIQIGTVLNWGTTDFFTVGGGSAPTWTGSITPSGATNPVPTGTNYNAGINLRGDIDKYITRNNKTSNFYYGIYYQSSQFTTPRNADISNNQIINCPVGIFTTSASPTWGIPLTIPVVNNTFTNVTTPLGGSPAPTICQRLGTTLIIDPTSLTIQADGGPNRGTWLAGDKILYTTPSAGSYVGAVCTTSGTQGTLNSGTTTISGTGSTLTPNSRVGLILGSIINIVGATPSGTRTVTAFSGSSDIVVIPALTNTVSSAAVSYAAASWQRFGVITLSGSATAFAPTINAGTSTTQDITVTGAAVNDIISYISFTQDLQGLVVTAWVQSANTVRVRLQNVTAGNITLTSGTLTVNVIKA